MSEFSDEMEGKMKIKICLMVFMILFVTTFAACTKDKPPLYDEQEESEPEKVTEMKTADLLFIARGSYLVPGNETQIENMLKILNEKTIKDFNMDISIEWARERNYANDIVSSIASGAAPDAIEVYFPHEIYYSLAQSGELLDIGTMFAELMPNAYDECQNKFPDSFDNMQYDGHNYILPTLKANPVRYCIVTIKTLYQEYGKTVETLEDYEGYLQWISGNYPEMIPGYGDIYYIYEAYLAGKGYSTAVFSTYINIEDKQMKAVPIEKLKEFNEVYSMLSRWNENDYFGGLSYPEFQTAANYGKLASFFINTKDTDFRKEIMMMPADREYQYIILYPDTKIVAQNPQGGMVFTKNGDTAGRIMQFIEHMYEDSQYYNLFHYGVEGENYNIKNGRLFLNMNQNVRAIANWWGSTSISSYHMELPIWSEPEDYGGFLKKISFTNTVSQRQVFENAGVDYDDVYRYESDTDSMAILASETDSLMEKRMTVFSQFMRSITQGDFSKSEDEIAEMFADSNGQELADAFNNAIEQLKNN
jgi:putative aldouronate transport system substrate-binding protein